MSVPLQVLLHISSLYERLPEEAVASVSHLFEDLTLKIETSLDHDAIRERLALVPKFSERIDRTETAVRYFRRNYEGLLGTGKFYRDDLRRHDVRLYMTLSDYQGEHGKTLSDLIPSRPRPTRGTPKSVAELGVSDRPRRALRG